MKIIKYIARLFIFFSFILIGLSGLYVIGSFGLSKISVNSDYFNEKTDTLSIYVITNGVHTDLVLPITSDLINWKHFVNPLNTKSNSDNYDYVAFGWGDKGFYLETPTWADLKFKTAFKALFYLSSSVMHVTFHKRIPKNKNCKMIRLSKEKYNMIIKYIITSFKLDNKIPILIHGESYDNNDLFYEGIGTYNLFYTCNTWTNNGLKYADLKACLWTPFDSEILNKY